MTLDSSVKKYLNFSLTLEKEVERERLVSQIKLLIMLDSPVNIDVRDYPQLSSNPLEMAMCIIRGMFVDNLITLNTNTLCFSSLDLYTTADITVKKDIVFCFVEQKVNTFFPMTSGAYFNVRVIERYLIKAIDSFKSKPKERIKPTLD